MAYADEYTQFRQIIESDAWQQIETVIDFVEFKNSLPVDRQRYADDIYGALFCEVRGMIENTDIEFTRDMILNVDLVKEIRDMGRLVE